MSKARDLANAGTALGAVTATELGYVDGVTSAIQTQIDSKEATLPSQTGNSGKYLTTNGTAKSWGTVSQYALPTQTGNSGKFLTTNGTTESWGTVTSPITWTLRLLETSSRLNRVEYNGSNLWVAVGNDGKLWSSSDATTWTSRTSQFSTDRVNDVAYGNGLWVAVGQNGKISTSTDGTTWTARTSNMSTNDIKSVVYANSLWVAVGNGGGSTNTGGITYSSDGITWTRKSQTNNAGQSYNDVVWNGTNWVIGASLSTNNFLYASDPSSTWTVGNTNGGDAVHRIFWDGTRHITQEYNPYNYIQYSTSTTLGTTTSYPYTFGVGGTSKGYTYLYNGELYASNGVYWQILSPNPSSPLRTIPNFVPGIAANRTSSATPNIGEQSVTIWVGSQGIIMATNIGIFTSF